MTRSAALILCLLAAPATSAELILNETAGLVLDESAYCRSYVQFQCERLSPAALRADAVRMGPHENSDSESARPDSVAPGGPHSGATPEYEGTIELVAYDYGDGVSYLYSSSGNHLQIQCRILDISEAPMARE